MSASLVGSEMCIRDRSCSSEALATTANLPCAAARDTLARVHPCQARFCHLPSPSRWRLWPRPAE
eukprot:6661606-Alexandrium_andersonii.AAC.1